jgi:two-component system sensor histidine kinase AlgZ
VLLLQPLLENAVYHGVQPVDQGGTVRVGIARQADSCVIDISNPLAPSTGVNGGGGHGMALDNTRRRLEALYAGGAQLDTREQGGSYRVRIALPLDAAGENSHG